MEKQKRYSFEFWAVPKIALEDSRLSLEEATILGILWTRTNGENLAWPAQKTLADSIGRSVSSVKNYLRHLEATGYLKRIRKVREGRFRGNYYELYDHGQNLPQVTNNPLTRQPVDPKPVNPLPIHEENIEENKEKNIYADISLSKESLGNEELPPPKEEPLRSESPRSRESLLQAIALWKKEIEYLGLPPKVTTVDYVKLSAFLKERGYGNWKWLLDYMFWDKSSPFYREKKLTIAPYIRTLLADAFVGLWAMNGESEERKAKYDSM